MPSLVWPTPLGDPRPVLRHKLPTASIQAPRGGGKDLRPRVRRLDSTPTSAICQLGEPGGVGPAGAA